MMHLDTVSLVKPPHSRNGTGPGPFIMKWLERDARAWHAEFQRLARKNGVPLNLRSRVWSDDDVTRELPTDLITYFVYQVDPSIAPEIGTVLLDGRVHLILVLSETALPLHEEWFRHMPEVPLKAERTSGGVLTPVQQANAPTIAPLLHLHEMQGYTRQNMRQLLELLLRRKREFGY